MKRIFRTAGLAAVLALVSLSAACVGSPAAAPRDNVTALPGGSAWLPGDLLPLAPELVKKTLPNGLTYYVRRNGNPGGRAVMFLVIASGSSNERDDQSGYAHFVEHMAFNGTKSFPENDLVKYLRSIGMDFGAEINAHTTREETLYTLEMPLDNPAYFDTGLKVLKEWATAVTFDPVEVEKEKGVILEERRLGIGPEEVARNREIHGLLAGSIHADREPIGFEASIKSAGAEGLRAFYEANYRPDRMAVIVVGDIDTRSVAAKIEKEFSFPAADGSVKPRPTYPVVTTKSLGFVASFDEDFDPSVISYRKIVLYEPETVIGDYLDLLRVRVTAEAIRLRLSDLSRTGKAAWREAYFDDDYFFGRTRLYSFSLSVSTGGEAAAFAGLASEVERLRRFGFTESEFRRTIDLYRRWLATLNVEDDDLKSRSFAEEYVRNFMYGEPVPGVVNERVYIRSFLDSAKLEDLNEAARTMLAADEGFVAVRAKPVVGTVEVNETAFGQILRDARNARLEQVVTRSDEGGLFDSLPEAGSIVAEKELASKITELTLSNGARVLLRPTNYDKDAISFFAWSPGGYLSMPVGSQSRASLSPTLMSAAGLGAMSATRIDELTASLNAGLQWSIGEDGEVMAGKTITKDLETFLRIVYLTAAEPGRDAAAFNAARDKLADQVGPYVRDPGYRFQTAWSTDLFGGNPRAAGIKSSDVKAIDFGSTRDMVLGAFANASDFTYVLVGDFDMETAKTLVARHLGAIPAGTVKVPKWEMPLVARTGGGQVSFKLSREDRASVRMVWAAPSAWSWQREATMELLGQALNNRLLDALREDLGGTYVVSTRAAFSKTPVEQYSLIVQFDTESSRVDEMVAKVRAEVAKIVAGDFDPMYVRQIGAAAQRDLDGRARTNEFWVNRIANSLSSGMDFEIMGRARETLKFVDPLAFRTLASELLVPNREFVYVMLPE
jgi:zinc protease